jgi:hypothetical protein
MRTIDCEKLGFALIIRVIRRFWRRDDGEGDQAGIFMQSSMLRTRRSGQAELELIKRLFESADGHQDGNVLHQDLGGLLERSE